MCFPSCCFSLSCLLTCIDDMVSVQNIQSLTCMHAPTFPPQHPGFLQPEQHGLKVHSLQESLWLTCCHHLLCSRGMLHRIETQTGSTRLTRLLRPCQYKKSIHLSIYTSILDFCMQSCFIFCGHAINCITLILTLNQFKTGCSFLKLKSGTHHTSRPLTF